MESRAACTSAAPDGKINRIILPNCSFLPLPSRTRKGQTPSSVLPGRGSGTGITSLNSRSGRKIRGQGTGPLPERNGKYSPLDLLSSTSNYRCHSGIRQSFMRLSGPAKICHKTPLHPSCPSLSFSRGECDKGKRDSEPTRVDTTTAANFRNSFLFSLYPLTLARANFNRVWLASRGAV